MEIKGKLKSCQEYEGTITEQNFNDWCVSNNIDNLPWDKVCEFMQVDEQEFNDFDVDQYINYQWIKRKASDVIFEFIIDMLRNENNKIDQYVDYMEFESI